MAIGDGAAIPVLSPGLCQSGADAIQEGTRDGVLLGSSLALPLEGLLLFRLSLAAKAVPFGFKNAATFGNFGRLLNGGLARLGLGETKALLQGSAVTGRSFKSGEVFDVGRVSDFDIALAGSGIFNRAKALGIALRSGGTRTGPLTKSQIERLGLKPLRDLLSRLAGRDVNFMIFEDAATAAARAPSVPIP